jgi:hypothetical protein
MITETLQFAAVVAVLAFLAGHRFGKRAGVRDGFTRGEQCGVIAGRQAERGMK